MERNSHDELMELLNELRVQLPGVQMLFAFLVAAPFSAAFDRVSALDRRIYFGGFLSTAMAAACLTAPSVYHRLHWRRDVRDQDLMLRTANQLALVGSVFLALGMVAVAYVFGDVLFGSTIAFVTGSLLSIVFGWLWYALPLSRRKRGI